MNKVINANEKKPSSTKAIVGLVIAIILFAILGVFLFIINSDYLIGEPQDFYEMVEDGRNPEKGEYVSINVDAVVDWYAETSYKINGFIPAGKEQHCLVWLDNNAFISLTVKGKENIANIDDIIDGTQSFLYGETEVFPEGEKFVGKLSTIDPEVAKYYNEILDMYEIVDDGEITVYQLTIDASDTKLSIWIYIGIMAIIDIVCIVSLVVLIKRRKNEKEAALMQSSVPVYNENDNFPYQQ